jgi:type II restriction/modification system DNA methylase subunit YeeA
MQEKLFSCEGGQMNTANRNINKRVFIVNASIFFEMPGTTVAYWAPKSVIDAFQNTNLLSQLAKPRVGLQTSNNERFIRLWFEIDYTKMRFGVSDSLETLRVGGKWFPHNKGGEFRKWYGNNYYVVDYEKDGLNIKKEKAENLRLGLIEKKNSQCWNSEYYFKEALTWSRISSSNFGIRYSPVGFVFDTAGTSIFADHVLLMYLLGLLTSKVVNMVLQLLNPTLTFQTGDISNIPVVLLNDSTVIISIVDSSIELSKKDWDSYENSWDYKKHPLL